MNDKLVLLINIQDSPTLSDDFSISPVSLFPNISIIPIMSSLEPGSSSLLCLFELKLN